MTWVCYHCPVCRRSASAGGLGRLGPTAGPKISPIHPPSFFRERLRTPVSETVSKIVIHNDSMAFDDKGTESHHEYFVLRID